MAGVIVTVFVVAAVAYLVVRHGDNNDLHDVIDDMTEEELNKAEHDVF